MESGMIIIGAILFASVAIPTLLIYQNTKKQSRKLFNGLMTIVSKDNGTLTQHVEETNFALGVDEVNKTVYFFKKTEDEEISKKIDLKEITSCEVFITTRRIKKEKGHEDLIEKIALQFISKKDIEVAQIELYDQNDSFLAEELIVGKEWKKIIQRVLSEKNVITEPTLEHKQNLTVALS